MLSSTIMSCLGRTAGPTEEARGLNQIMNAGLADAGTARVEKVGNSRAELLRALSMMSEALEAMVRADCLTLEERRAFIAEFERETDSVLAGLIERAASSRLPRRSFQALFSAARESCATLLLAHRSCLGLAGSESCSGDLARRLLRGAARLLKWQGLARGPAHGALWAWVDAATHMLRAHSGDAVAHDRAVQDEPSDLLLVLATQSAGYERIPLQHAPALDALLRRLMPQFCLSGQVMAEFALAYHEGSRSPPSRPGAGGAETGRTLYFSVAAARDSVVRCKAALASGRSPAMLGFPDIAADQLRGALSHLARCWNPEKTRRRSYRHRVDNALYLANGIEAIQLALCDGLPPAMVHCRLVDISKHGARVLASTRYGASRLDVGQLLAFRACDGNAWHIGQVRRVWLESEQEMSVGVETLAAHAFHAQLDDGRNGCDVICWGPFERGKSVRVVLDPAWQSEADTLFVNLNGTVRKVRLESRVRLNDDATLAVCRVL